CLPLYRRRTMARDEPAELIKLGATAWNSWRAGQDEGPDLFRAALRGPGFSRVELSVSDPRGAGLQGGRPLAGDPGSAHLEAANLFKAVLDGATLAGAFLQGALFLNCAQLVVTRNWQAAFRDDALACGAAIPPRTEGSTTTRREP